MDNKKLEYYFNDKNNIKILMKDLIINNNLKTELKKWVPNHLLQTCYGFSRAIISGAIPKFRVFQGLFRSFGISPLSVMYLGDQSVMKRESALDPLR